ncbi:MgtC/SapB family protein, partial [Actinomyces oris]
MTTRKGVGVDTLFSLNHVGVQVVAMLATFVLCLTLGAERHLRHKDAGVKTHVLVGLGSCLFTLVSAYGFAPITGSDVAVDPSRVAAQIVSGIGFLGAGVIFVNNDTVRGLTTAATVWLSAAIGMACGAGMIPLAATAVALDYIVVLFLGPLTSRLQRRRGEVTVRIDYE